MTDFNADTIKPNLKNNLYSLSIHNRLILNSSKGIYGEAKIINSLRYCIKWDNGDVTYGAYLELFHRWDYPISFI